MRSNPVDYKLPLMKSWDGRPAAFKTHRKLIKLICASMMRRVKAAYKRSVAMIEAGAYVGETRLSALAQYACEAEDGINQLYTVAFDYLNPEKLGWGTKLYLSGEYSHVDVANNYIRLANDAIKNVRIGTQQFETYAYRGHSVNKGHHSEETDRELQLRWAKTNREITRKLFLDLRERFPYVRPTYRNRTIKLAVSKVAYSGRMTRHMIHHEGGALTMTDLLKIGIPAVDIVGPWWPRTPDIKSPMDYIDFTDKHSDIRIIGRPDVTRGVNDRESPSVDDWLHVINLDGGDRELRDACFQYYQRHKAAPSVKWAQERSNQLDEERSKKEIEEQIPTVAQWLKYSQIWRDTEKVFIPILPGSEWKVLGPKDARKLCETAKRDGLCVLDVITGFIDWDPYDVDDAEDAKKIRDQEPRDGRLSDGLLDYCEQDGVATLLLCTDPKRRTVVGLDSNGECTSEHHCTGVQNKVDKEAWEYFRAKA